MGEINKIIYAAVCSLESKSKVWAQEAAGIEWGPTCILEKIIRKPFLQWCNQKSMLPLEEKMTAGKPLKYDILIIMCKEKQMFQ